VVLPDTSDDRTAMQVEQAMQAMRASTMVMSGAGDGRKEWKFYKGINDYGKEQTYMSLGAKTDGKRFVVDPFGTEGNGFLEELWANAYLIALFLPAVIAGVYVLAGQPLSE
jgi:hypothetical protein